VPTQQLSTAVRHAMPADRPAIANALSRAFHDDPVGSWLVPDGDQRQAVLPRMFDLFADLFIPHGEARVTDDGTGAALWLPPETELVTTAQIDAFAARIGELAGEDAPRTFALMDAQDAHHPHDPAYYLMLVGVLPESQGQGIGASLITPVLEQCEREGVGAYLEATSVDSRRLYERLGFETIGEFAPEGCPPLWPMWRAS
jgi:ribosomal protein S18 acetylase RimI-like enzyme